MATTTLFPNVTFSELFSSDYIGPSYQLTQWVTWLHAAPRAGYSSEFAQITSSNQEEQNSYIIGASFLSIILSVFFFTWGISLLILRRNSSKFGFLSGANFLEIYSSDGASASFTDDFGLIMPQKRPRRVRITFVVVSCLLVLCCVLWTVYGIEKTAYTITSLQENTQESIFILDESVNVVGNLTLIGVGINSVAAQMQNTTLETICPGGNLLELLDIGEEFDPRMIGEDLNALQSNVANNSLLMDVKENLVRTRSSLSNVDYVLEHTENYNWYPLVIAIPLVVCTAFFNVGVILIWLDASHRIYQKFLSYLVLPTFLVFVLATTIVSCAFSIVTVMNSDACAGGELLSPDYTVENVMVNLGMSTSSLEFDIISYIIEGCNGRVNPFIFINDYQVQLQDSIEKLDLFAEVVTSIDVERLNSFCNKDLTPIIEALLGLNVNLSELYQLALKTLTLLSCPTLNKLYAASVYDTACTYSPETLGWIYFLLIAITSLSWILLTLRASYLVNEKYVDSKKIAQDLILQSLPSARYNSDSYISTSGKVIPSAPTPSASNDQSMTRPYYDNNNFLPIAPTLSHGSISNPNSVREDDEGFIPASNSSHRVEPFHKFNGSYNSNSLPPLSPDSFNLHKTLDAADQSSILIDDDKESVKKSLNGNPKIVGSFVSRLAPTSNENVVSSFINRKSNGIPLNSSNSFDRESSNVVRDTSTIPLPSSPKTMT